MIIKIGHIIGYILIFLGISELIPILASLNFDEYYLILPFLICSLLTIFIGLGFYFAFPDRQEKPNRYDIISFLVISWIIIPIFGSIPFMVSGELTKFTDAYFEATSAFTTSGSTLLANSSLAPKTLLFWRALLQWFGGIYIFVLAVSIVPLSAIGGAELYKGAFPHGEREGFLSRIKAALKPLSLIYVGFTLLCLILLRLSGLSFFDAMVTSMASLSSGGFTNHSNFGVNSFNNISEFILVPFMLIGATILKKVGVSIFTAASAMSTTGFLPDGANSMPLGVVIICAILLCFGGSMGSSAGGFKIIRFRVLFRQAVNEISRLAYPHGVVPMRVNDFSVSSSILVSIWTLLFLYLSSIGLFSILYGMLGYDMEVSIGLTFANLFSAGSMTGLIAQDFLGYGGMSYAAKWLTSGIMILGRLEIIALLIFLSPSYRKK